jgi:hypothetical protein
MRLQPCKKRNEGRHCDAQPAGEIVLDVERVPLARVGNAWRRQEEGVGAKLVVIP